jgi:hypothetical protein
MTTTVVTGEDPTAPTSPARTPTRAMLDGRNADSARRRQRVLATLERRTAEGSEISVSAIARAALLTELVVVFVQFSDRLLIESLIRPCRRPPGICRF